MIEDRKRVVTWAGSRKPHHLGVLDAARAFGKGVALEDTMTAIFDAAIELTHAQQGVLLFVKSSGDIEVAAVRDARRVFQGGGRTSTAFAGVQWPDTR